MKGGVQVPATGSPARSLLGLLQPSTLVFVAGVVIYRIVLDLIYQRVVGPSYAYQGFPEQASTFRLLISWAFLIALIPLIVRVMKSETLSAQLAALLGLLSLVPTTTLIAYDALYHGAYVVLMFGYWAVFLLASLLIPPIRPFRAPLRSEIPHLIVVAITSATILYVSWKFTGFRLHFGLFDVYDLRAEAREYPVATVLGYFAAIGDNVLPVLLAYYLRRRWFLLSAAVGLVILVNFGIAATKQVLFLLILAVASISFGESGRFQSKMMVALTLVAVGCLVEFLLLGTIFLTELSAYRLMFLPAHLHWIHYEFFQSNEFLHLTQSALKFLFESPYPQNVQFLLGDYFIGDIEARANNGLFSDGYMNFGAVGAFIYPVLVVFLLKLLEGAAEGLSAGVQFMLIASLSFIFLGLPLPTAVLSAGVGVLVLLLATLPRPVGYSSVRT